jgi:hypothetical protein
LQQNVEALLNRPIALKEAMTAPLIILLLTTIALAVYLLVVMVKPEWF